MSGSLSVLDILAVVGPVFVTAGLGFLWKRGRQPYDSAFIRVFVVNVATPCLVFSSLSKVDLAGDRIGPMALAALATVALTAVVAAGALVVLRQSMRSFLPALSLPNSGNLGIPVCLFAFGDAGLTYAVVFSALMALTQFTLAPIIAAGRFDGRALLRTPLIYALAAALVVAALGLPLPAVIGNTAGLLGACAVPLMLFSLGATLAGFRPVGSGTMLALSALRVGLGFAVGLVVAYAMGLTGTMRGVLILQSTMPVAVFSYLWAEAYGNQPDKVAGIVLGSTVLVFAVLPLLLVVAVP